MDYKAIVDKLKNNKHTRIVIFCILLAGLLIFVNSLAKYTNRIQGSTTVRPASFGKLALQEYDSDGNPVAENNSETISLSSLSTINKRVNLKYSKGDIKTYIFFIIKANGWSYDAGEKKVAIMGRNNDLVYIQINDNWNYLEAPNVDSSTFVFYHLVDIDERFEDDVISSINVNPISYGEQSYLEGNHDLSFSATVVQKVNDEPAITSWNLLNNN